MLLYPGAFNMTTGPLHWELLLRGRAVDTQCFVAGIAPARTKGAGYQSYGNTMLVDPWGKILCRADADEEIVYADIGEDPANLLLKLYFIYYLCLGSFIYFSFQSINYNKCTLHLCKWNRTFQWWVFCCRSDYCWGVQTADPCLWTTKNWPVWHGGKLNCPCIPCSPHHVS